MNIGLIGFGGVGKAFIKLLNSKKHKLNSEIKLKYIINSKGGVYNKDGINIADIIYLMDNNIDISTYKHWYNKMSFKHILDNNDIDYLVELTSTNIETGEPGLTHIKGALENKINVITGNKGPILLAYKELMDIARDNSVVLKIGCTTGGALPSITGGVVDCAGSEIKSIQGILNGTTNYILSKMRDEEISYEKALSNAQKEGIAELNPSLDVEGFDTAVKILILANSIYGSNLTLKDINVEGITNVQANDIIKLKSNNKKLKLIGEIRNINDKVTAKVKLEAIDDNHPLYSVDFKNKGIVYKTDTLGDISIIGGASGTINAAASILRDIINIK